MKNRSRGFTLMELMVVLALAAVILAIGAPSFNEFRRNNRLTGIANDFLGSVQFARTEAIKRQTPVVMCPSDNGSDAAAVCTEGPFRGWIVFVDADNNCERDTSDEEEVVLRGQPRVDNDAAKPLYFKTDGECISFAATGFRQILSGKDSASRVVFCDERGNTKQGGTEQSAARGIEVTPTGRTRVTRVIDEITEWNLKCLES